MPCFWAARDPRVGRRGARVVLAGVVEPRQHSPDSGEPRAALVVGAHHRPGRRRAVRALEGFRDGIGVGIPSPQALDVESTESFTGLSGDRALGRGNGCSCSVRFPDVECQSFTNGSIALVDQQRLEAGQLPGKKTALLPRNVPKTNTCSSATGRGLLPGPVEKRRISPARTDRSVPLALEIPLPACRFAVGGLGEARGSSARCED